MAEKEYIERDYILRTFSSMQYPWTDFEDAYEIVQNAPTADVVEVVRCSECKYATEVEYLGCACKNEKTPWCNDEFEVYMNPTDFCSYGERRTDDD